MASDPPEIIFAPKLDTLERNVRLGCGSIFGLAFGFVAGLYWWPTPLGVGTLVIVSFLTCAWMALKLGDRFWTDFIGKLFSWW